MLSSSSFPCKKTQDPGSRIQISTKGKTVLYRPSGLVDNTQDPGSRIQISAKGKTVLCRPSGLVDNTQDPGSRIQKKEKLYFTGLPGREQHPGSRIQIWPKENCTLPKKDPGSWILGFAPGLKGLVFSTKGKTVLAFGRGPWTKPRIQDPGSKFRRKEKLYFTGLPGREQNPGSRIQDPNLTTRKNCTLPKTDPGSWILGYAPGLMKGLVFSFCQERILDPGSLVLHPEP